MAEILRETKALDRRYNRAYRDAKEQGCENNVRSFEKEIEENAYIVMNRTKKRHTLEILSKNGHIYRSYHWMTEKGLQIPEGSKWDTWRGATDNTLFGLYKNEINFAALSLTKSGLSHYGDYSWTLKNSMVSYRTSLFEENSVMFMVRRGLTMEHFTNLPAGYRAAWRNRTKLCVAKLWARISKNTKSDDFQNILMSERKEAWKTMISLKFM